MKVVDAKDVNPLEFPGRSLTVLFSPENGSEQMTTAISKVPPGGSLPWHAHERADEVIYVMHGRGLASHETLKDPVEVFPGSTLFMPRGQKHSIENKGDAEMQLYCAFSPAIRFGAPTD